MENILSLKIVGLDTKRPPRIRKEPYIDIFFELSDKAPKEWCDDFNKVGKQIDPPAKINTKEGLFIEAWVRNMDDIQKHLNIIKTKVTACNNLYIENIKLKELAEIEKNAALLRETGSQTEQSKLNKILVSLDYGT